MHKLNTYTDEKAAKKENIPYQVEITNYVAG